MNRNLPADHDEPFVPSKRITAEGLWWVLLLTAVAVVGAALVIAVFFHNGRGNAVDLRRAASTDPAELLPLLLAGADPNEVDPLTGETALTLAITFSNYESVKLLLENGADPNLTGPHGPPLLSPHLDYSDYMSVPIIRLLLEHGADLNGQDALHQSALHRAAESGNLEILNYLLSQGADIDLLSDYGTPFHVARRNGQADIAQALLDAGADDTLPDPGGPVGTVMGPHGGLPRFVPGIVDAPITPAPAP